MSPDTVANCALRHYDTHLRKGRPKSEGEWTVYAAIVAEQKDKMWVLSAATGTKCTAKRVDGCVLHDCHAEVLTRRGMVRVLCRELAKGDQSDLLDRQTEGKCKIKSDIFLHLYISCSPCGDASIYPVSNNRILYTGAKLVVLTKGDCESSKDGDDNQQLLQGTCVAREKVQTLGKLRVKSGRSNLPPNSRSSSMSCSDKLVCWQVIGMQGSLLSRAIENVRLSSIVVSRDIKIPDGSSAQDDALDRAISDRIRSICTDLPGMAAQQIVPSMHTVSAVFPFDKTFVESRGVATIDVLENDQIEPSAVGRKRKREGSFASASPCGLAVNWQSCDSDRVEILVGARGVLQGRKPNLDLEYERLASRLSRSKILRLVEELGIEGEKSSYSLIKQEMGDSKWLELKTKVLSMGPLSGWLRNQVSGDFVRASRTPA